MQPCARPTNFKVCLLGQALVPFVVMLNFIRGIFGNGMSSCSMAAPAAGRDVADRSTRVHPVHV
jgi:hypothetical protein